MTRLTITPRHSKQVDSRPAPIDEVLPSNLMTAMLHRERLRADRNGAVFAVLSWEVSPAAMEAVLQTLRLRLRQTDVVGFLAPDTIGVFLPDTPASGARKVVGDVLALLPADVLPARCEVGVYPDPSQSEPTNGRPRSHRDSNDSDNPPHNGNGHGARYLTNGASTNGNGQPERRNKGNTVSHAQGLREHFAEPLPYWKRSLDILGALCGLAAFSPMFLAAAAAVKLSSRGPVFFCQRRAGLGGRPFTMWKFRTMREGAEQQQQEIMHLNEQDGAAFKVKDDPRVTTIGRLLRKTSIDELPQLWNVLWGDMSLVGPRPLPLHEAENCLLWQQRRLDITPGLTCIWQAHGRSRVSFEEWMRMDLRYARRRTLRQDLVLVLQTIPAVLWRRGAS